MNPYEMTFIVRPDRDEEETRAVVETVMGRVEAAGGEVVATAPWNPPRRRMAYPIKEFSDGFYVTTVFRMDGESLRAFENGLKLNENVLRYLVVRASDLQVQQVQQRAQQPQQVQQPAQTPAPPPPVESPEPASPAASAPEAATAEEAPAESAESAEVETAPTDLVAEAEENEPVAAAAASESEE